MSLVHLPTLRLFLNQPYFEFAPAAGKLDWWYAPSSNML